MSKIEEAREFIQNNPILKHGILEDEVPKLMADFATSQPLNLDVKVDDDWQPLEEPNETKEDDGNWNYQARFNQYQQAKTVRQKIAKLEFELDSWKRSSLYRKEQIEQLTQELDEWKDKYNGLQLPFSHRVYIPDLQQQLSAEKQKNEKLSKNFGMFLDRVGDALEDNQSFGYLSIEADEIQQQLNK